MEPAVRVHGLEKSYASRIALDSIELTIPSGECVGLLGPNGAGKTTLLKLILGLIPCDAGSIRVLGETVDPSNGAFRSRVGVVPQDHSLDLQLTVEENLRTYARYFGSPTSKNFSLESLLHFVALEDRRNTPVHKLSGGLKRRLALARALINDPELLILDEPTTGLDLQARELVWERLRSLVREGRSVIVTTHSMDEAQRLSDQLVILDQGRILCQGSPSDLIRSRVEPHIVEIEHGARYRQSLAAVLPSDCRNELAGDSLLVYASAKDSLAHLFAYLRQSRLKWLHRLANLEDVFLRLTGRGLRD